MPLTAWLLRKTSAHDTDARGTNGQVIYQPTRPPMHRSGSVPSGHTHSMDASDHYVSSGHSDTYPYHCPNVGDGPVIVHTNDR
ncbi:hypothetical protein ElyMa_004203400 [Elysia marginata]|uniref:Uncharacterized protein n=1 Tax=Elysia marginata TaxID=1093978 RepID=A0AAV4GQJ0_9GAST|nr:hypothetical protein ElyMa_004203400 [Elysia marginata]